MLGWLELSSGRRLALFIAITAAAGAVTLMIPADVELADDARRALFILLLAAGLWLTETIPAFAVGILVIALQVLLLGRPTSEEGDWERHVLVLGHPLIWLFFGGLVLAAGMSRTGVDQWLAARALTRFADRPRHMVAAVAAIAFVLSMIMSNTATTAMMLALIAPLIAGRPSDDRFATTLILAVAVGANLGGMGSLVDAPNASCRRHARGPGSRHLLRPLVRHRPAAGTAAGADPDRAAPAPARSRRPPRRATERSGLRMPDRRCRTGETLVVVVTLATTLGLWLSQDLHGLPTPVVAVVPVVLLTATGILDVDAFRRLSYDVLFLIAGGLALGQAIQDTGLAAWLVGQVADDALPLVWFAILSGFAAVVLSNVMSNTAAANVLVPLTLTATGDTATVLTVALCASAAMALPVATPPNALAHATGRIHARDFLALGLVCGLLAPPLTAVWTSLVAPLVLE
ncbi:MAG: SLC13 family permease [Gammaproteobacteria bacterium]|nr:SLC13 family permease [Gammaproteobacteria bacterium]